MVTTGMVGELLRCCLNHILDGLEDKVKLSSLTAYYW